MKSGRLSRIRRILYYPLWGHVVPRDAKVDPKRFPEDEFPVWCPKCRYLLRGISDGRCPECGSPFEMGRLLVRQYVREWGLPSQHRLRKVWITCSSIGLVITALSGGAAVAIGISLPFASTADIASRAAWLKSLLPCAAAGIIMYFGTQGFLLATAIRGRAKRRQVLAALATSASTPASAPDPDSGLKPES